MKRVSALSFLLGRKNSVLIIFNHLYLHELIHTLNTSNRIFANQALKVDTLL